MKSLKESLFDKKGTLDRDVYKYHPHTKKELINCIKEELRLQGPNANLNIIDVSEITDMYCLFRNIFQNMEIRNIDIDISKWDVSGVKDMSGMFWGCKNFNCDLSKWDVSNVKDMNYMFCRCEKFNCDLSKWDVSKVENMSNTFSGCKDFNSDLSKWNVSEVKDMFFMFYGCKKFNSDLSRWDVKNVKYTESMFCGCISLKKIPSWYK